MEAIFEPKDVEDWIPTIGEICPEWVIEEERKRYGEPKIGFSNKPFDTSKVILST